VALWTITRKIELQLLSDLSSNRIPKLKFLKCRKTIFYTLHAYVLLYV